MSLNNTPSSERLHIGIFGKRNAGKSSVINAITGQNLAIVSDIKGTTTDPVLKAMEILPIGPVVIIDTPGLDDEGELGQLRIQKAYQSLNKTDIAILVVDGKIGITHEDNMILEKIKEKDIHYIIALNKMDDIKKDEPPIDSHTIRISAKEGKNFDNLKKFIAKQIPAENKKNRIIGDIISPLDFILLVVPIDSAAPKGRLILPQQQTIRDILDSNATAIVTKETAFAKTLESLAKKPKLVITDSQVFEKISRETPKDILLTSFSILFARYKGDLNLLANGAKKIDALQNGDTILISEACTHHRQCDDIGTVKLPRLIANYTKKELQFKFSSGTEFPDDLGEFKMIIHCGGCMLNEKEMKYRLMHAKEKGIPITNYGIAMAHMHGILKRCLEPFGTEIF